MPPIQPTLPPGKSYPIELQTLLEKASQGDLSLLPDLKKAFDENPELSTLFGDLVEHAKQSLLTLAAGSCLTAKEAISRQAAELRERLSARVTSELENLLIDRVVISWIQVYYSDIDLARFLLKSFGASSAVQAAQKRLDRAHARYLTAIKALATMQKLLKPSLSPLDLALKLAPEGKAGSVAGQRPVADPAKGIPA